MMLLPAPVSDSRVRLARADDDPDLLQNIERIAGRQLEAYGLSSLFWEFVTPTSKFVQVQQHGLLWVATDAGDRPVGFAIGKQVDGAGHLDELAVHPAHGKQGLGRALVERVCTWARERGYRAITLSTLRDVPFNAPFYARLGFAEISVSEAGPELKKLREQEAAAGFPMERRVLMRRPL